MRRIGIVSISRYISRIDVTVAFDAFTEPSLPISLTANDPAAIPKAARAAIPWAG